MAGKTYDFIIIGAGIVGLALATQLRRQYADQSILIIEKEADVAQHASGRNSGVLHAGFYYTADSLKARFTVAGNKILKDFCRERGLSLNECGKLVVALDEDELKTLHELDQRGRQNGSNIRMVSVEEAMQIEPNVLTYQKALYSPDTATVDPAQVCQKMKEELEVSHVKFLFSTRYLNHNENTLNTSKGSFEAGIIINAAGLYADQIAHDFGFGMQYTIVPFKGLYLKYVKNRTDLRINIYPVPNLMNPFLGVHFTKTVDGTIKIGPTAIPCFWREQYNFSSRFSTKELAEILFWEAKLFLSNSFHFRTLAFEEIRKYKESYLISLAARLVRDLDPAGFAEFTEPGIRAQLLNRGTLSLVQDFVVEGDSKTVHVLNAVSPAFTCAFPFADYVIEQYVKH